MSLASLWIKLADLLAVDTSSEGLADREVDTPKTTLPIDFTLGIIVQLAQYQLEHSTR